MMDKNLAKIVGRALKSPNPKCPDCRVEGVIKGCSVVAWCECPKCRKEIGKSVIY